MLQKVFCRDSHVRLAGDCMTTRLHMPTIVRTVEGIVTALWGRAMIRGLDGKMKPLAIGDIVHRGDVILTTQDGIVQISEGDEHRIATRLPVDDLDTVIQAINDGDTQAAPRSEERRVGKECR